MTSGVFDGDVFRAWWKGLSAAERRPYEAKAFWEQRSLAAVISEWWPDVWASIGCERAQCERCGRIESAEEGTRVENGICDDCDVALLDEARS